MSDSYIGGAIISGLSNLMGIGISEANQREAMQEYNRGQMELAKYQNEWNLAQWERENSYNSPIQQMQRYREAGLNPNLIYGQQNLSAASPSAAGANLKPVPKNNAIGKFLQNLDIRNIMQEIDLKQAQKTLLESQAGYYQELQHNLGTRSEGQTLFNTYFGDPDNMYNLWKQNSYKTSIMGTQARDEQNRFDVDWNNFNPEDNPFVGSRRYYENNIVKVQSGQYEYNYDLSKKYDAELYRAKIYNLVHGTTAQQTAARGSLLSGTAAMQKIGLEGDKWNKLQDKIIAKYGHNVNEAYWNAVLAFEKADTHYGNYFNDQNALNLKWLQFDDLKQEEFYSKGLKMVDEFVKFFRKR